jgi:type I restriction-modification system DNA methylase subunit
MIEAKDVWKELQIIVNRGNDRSRVFEDWLDLVLAVFLSVTDNMGREKFIEKLSTNALDGVYEDRYKAIVTRYAGDRPKGERAIDHFVKALSVLSIRIEESQKDFLGDIYMEEISHGDHGQFFTPEHIADMMAKITGRAKAFWTRVAGADGS